jgi:hypothetical protein
LQLTGITQDKVDGQKTLEEVLQVEIADFSLFQVISN